MAETPKSAWWFDGAASGTDGTTSPPGDGGATGGMNVGALMSGAQQLIEWASELVLTPHAEHVDPSEHADCLICRGQQLLGSPIVQSAMANAAAGAVQFAGAPRPSAPVRTVRAPREITWIPVERRLP